MNNLTREESVALYAALKSEGIEAFALELVENGIPAYSIEIAESSLDLYRQLYPETQEDGSEADVDGVEYMNDFDDHEIFEVLENRNEYNPFMVKKAFALLEERGVPYNDEAYQLRFKKRLDEVRKGIEVSSEEIQKGYLLALAGGIGGFMRGWNWYNTDLKGPGGKIYQKYGTNTRKHGFHILILGSFSFIIITLLVILANLYFRT